ncbi:MAG: helix-turn-helix transcriptional regulator [Burkholderiaceae bacterium]
MQISQRSTCSRIRPPCALQDKLLLGRRPAEDRQLLAALKALLSVRHEAQAVLRQVLRLESTVPGRPMMLVLDRLLPAPTMQAFGRQPMALAILHDLSIARTIDPFIVAEVFDLTPAEAQVSVMLANGLSPEQIAAKRHVSTLTVRTQLRSVHAKIGVSRQADLVCLIREMPALGPGGLRGKRRDRLIARRCYSGRRKPGACRCAPLSLMPPPKLSMPICRCRHRVRTSCWCVSRRCQSIRSI